MRLTHIYVQIESILLGMEEKQINRKPVEFSYPFRTLLDATWTSSGHPGRLGFVTRLSLLCHGLYGKRDCLYVTDGRWLGLLINIYLTLYSTALKGM